MHSANLQDVSKNSQGFAKLGAATLSMHSANLQDVSSNSQGFAKLGEQQRRDVDEGARFLPSGSKRRRILDLQERK